MSFKLRFALRFTAVVAVILLTCFVAIYFLYADFRKEEFTKRLQHEGEEFYGFYQKQLRYQSPVELVFFNEIQKNILAGEEIVILDSLRNVVFAYPSTIQLGSYKKIITDLKENKELKKADDNRLYANVYFSSSKANVIVSGIDVVGQEQLLRLMWILVFTSLLALIITGILSYWLSKSFTRPLLELGKQMADVTGIDLKKRILENAQIAEIDMIASKFNAMLSRLEKTFEFQRSFVHHASHELRTPLATMLSHTESALKNNLNEEGYRTVLASLQQDQERMIELTNSLLLISQFEQQGFDELWPICRVDEILYDKISISVKMFPDIGISLVFSNTPSSDDDLNVRGNEALLKSMFSNLIRNGYLYSVNKKVEIFLEFVERDILVHVETRGEHLSEEEREKIMIPFFRGQQARQKVSGVGLGLTIVHRILTMHKGSLTYTPMPNQVNRFTVSLPKANMAQ
ncbi:MAG: hypothetical protein RLZZ429_1693 [Bacteroidota bacterium]